MAVQRIRTFRDPVLYEACREVVSVTARTRRILRDMADTLRAHTNGAGLSANQIGVSQRLIVVMRENRLLALVNPVILWEQGTQLAPEGCLSFPGLYGRVRRPMQVKVSALNEWGDPIVVTGSGEFAQCLAHEIDHLDGIVLPQLLHSRT